MPTRQIDHVDPFKDPFIASLAERFEQDREAAIQAANHTQWRTFCCGTILRLIAERSIHGTFEAYCRDRLGMPKQTQVRWRQTSKDMVKQLSKSTNLVLLPSLDALVQMLPELQKNQEFIKIFNEHFGLRRRVTLTDAQRDAEAESANSDSANKGDDAADEAPIITASQRQQAARQRVFDFVHERLIPDLEIRLISKREWEVLEEKDRRELADKLRAAALEVESSLPRK
ncbi:MAG: hypothetical protein E1N59_2851 [Puniceicoccaceae bacterium 5H]|nr:MAG: hypothetical protein E1N59_2851 [Puniceicoccaceae bacterium 5H]